MCIRVQLGLEWLDDIASWIFGQRKKRIARNWWKRRVWTGWEIKKIIQNHRWSAAQHLYVKSMATFPNLQINFKKKTKTNKQTNKQSGNQILWKQKRFDTSKVQLPKYFYSEIDETWLYVDPWNSVFGYDERFEVPSLGYGNIVIRRCLFDRQNRLSNLLTSVNHPVGPVTRSSFAICPLHPLLMRVVVLFILSIFDLLSVSVDRLWKNWMKCHSLTRDFRTRQHLLYQKKIIFWKHKPDEHWRDEQVRTYNRQPHKDKWNFDHPFGIPKFINAFVLVFFKKAWSLFLALFLYNSFVFDGLRSVTWRVMRTFTMFMLLNWTAEWQDSPFDPFSRS